MGSEMCIRDSNYQVRYLDHHDLIMAFALGLFLLLLVPGSSFAGLRTTRSMVRGAVGGTGGGGWEVDFEADTRSKQGKTIQV